MAALVSVIHVTCEAGHVFELEWEKFIPFDIPEIIASISWCKEMVSKPEHGNLLLECEARIVWIRRTGEYRQRQFVFRSKSQLDLFDRPRGLTWRDWVLN